MKKAVVILISLIMIISIGCKATNKAIKTDSALIMQVNSTNYIYHGKTSTIDENDPGVTPVKNCL